MPEMGELVACHFGVPQPTTAPSIAPTLVSPTGEACADWSIYQGSEPATAGLHCVIIQANFGLNREPSLYSQIHDAERHGVPWGAYTFGEPGVSGASEAQYANDLTEDRGRTLGLWFDAEVPGAYEHSCSYTAQARASGSYIYGLFSAPGMYTGRHCEGLLWPSEWEIPRPYAFAGYPSSAVVLWQSCGTCFRFGVRTDLDVNEGIIQRAKKPAPTRGQLEKELHADRKLRFTLRALEAKHGCRNPPEPHPTPNTAAYRHACYGVWVPQGRQVDKQISQLERKLR
jgi:hypothetical protein